MKISFDREQKRVLIRIALSVAILIIACLLPLEGLWRLPGFLVSYLIVAYDVIWECIQNICHGKIFDETFLMIVASVGALVLGAYPEALFVMLFFQVGEFFEEYAVEHSRKSIAALLDIAPEKATVMRNGKEYSVDPKEVEIGETIVIRPGERVPLDGVVLFGRSSLDTRALTGEALPRAVNVDDEVISGCINQDSVLEVKTTHSFSNSAVSRILELVEQSVEKKAKSESFVSKFAKYYTPIVVFAAVALALIPPLFFGQLWEDWIYRALIFLVVSCPCALVISIPLTFFGGIGAASRSGILVKGGNYLEMLAKTDAIVFDKTGTLTTGTFQVIDANEEALRLAAYVGCESTHPLSIAIREAWGKEIDYGKVSSIVEHSGRGISAVVDGSQVVIGSLRFLTENGVKIPVNKSMPGSVVYVAKEREYVGVISLKDVIKSDAKTAFSSIEKLGITDTCLLTGDRKEAAIQVSEELGIRTCKYDLLPQDKVLAVEDIIKEKTTSGNLVYVGDGINDAPVLARADIGIAMGALGSDAAIEAADIVLMDDCLNKIPLAISLSRKVKRIVIENIIFALGIKFLVLLLAVFGLVNLWIAVFADVGVAVLTILNAMRMLQTRSKIIR